MARQGDWPLTAERAGSSSERRKCLKINRRAGGTTPWKARTRPCPFNAWILRRVCVLGPSSAPLARTGFVSRLLGPVCWAQVIDHSAGSSAQAGSGISWADCRAEHT